MRSLKDCYMLSNGVKIPCIAYDTASGAKEIIVIVITPIKMCTGCKMCS